MNLKSIIPLMLILVIVLGVTAVQEKVEDPHTAQTEQLTQEVEIFETPITIDLKQSYFMPQQFNQIKSDVVAGQVYTTPGEHPYVANKQNNYLVFNKLKIIATKPISLYNLA